MIVLCVNWGDLEFFLSEVHCSENRIAGLPTTPSVCNQWNTKFIGDAVNSVLKIDSRDAKVYRKAKINYYVCMWERERKRKKHLMRSQAATNGVSCAQCTQWQRVVQLVRNELLFQMLEKFIYRWSSIFSSEYFRTFLGDILNRYKGRR